MTRHLRAREPDDPCLLEAPNFPIHIQHHDDPSASITDIFGLGGELACDLTSDDGTLMVSIVYDVTIVYGEL